MIIGFIGDIGSGKTLSMVKFAYSLYKKGAVVYSNFKLNFPHKFFTIDKILNYAESDKSFDNAVFLIDEAHIFMDSRRSSSANSVVISYFILQTRKKNITLMYTTQKIHSVDKRLRDNSDAKVMCSFKKSLDGGHEKFICLNIFYIQHAFRTVVKHHVFDAKKYFHLYNTNEIVRAI